MADNTYPPEQRAESVLAFAKAFLATAEDMGVCVRIERKIDPLNPGKAKHVVEVWPSRALREKG